MNVEIRLSQNAACEKKRDAKCEKRTPILLMMNGKSRSDCGFQRYATTYESASTGPDQQAVRPVLWLGNWSISVNISLKSCITGHSSATGQVQPGSAS